MVLKAINNLNVTLNTRPITAKNFFLLIKEEPGGSGSMEVLETLFGKVANYFLFFP